jgi:hypothetical protein
MAIAKARMEGFLQGAAADDKDFGELAKAAIPCGCEQPLVGYWLDGKRWQPRCRLCGKEFRVVEVK